MNTDPPLKIYKNVRFVYGEGEPVADSYEILRDSIIERCAQVALNFPVNTQGLAMFTVEIAAAIRAIKDKP